MERLSGLDPRPDYVARLADRGFLLNPEDPYWQETAAYRFSDREIDLLDDAATELHELCLHAVDVAIERDLFDRFAIPPGWKDYIAASWARRDPAIYGRFDFLYDGSGVPKLLEYNADTPTGLLEASVLQWDWLEQRGLPDQFNSIHEELIEAWKRADAHVQGMPKPLYFVCDQSCGEDWVTTEYLRDTAVQAGLETQSLNLADIGWNGSCFTDLREVRIPAFFKLYPWEFMARDAFGAHLLGDHTGVIEPVWKMLLSNKALLPLLWEIAPNHPNLLPAFHDQMAFGDAPHVKKALFGREGASVEIIDPADGEKSAGAYGLEGFVYQEYHRIAAFDGRFPVCGVWIVNGKACGLGIREDKTRITANASNFVPHYFDTV